MSPTLGQFASDDQPASDGTARGRQYTPGRPARRGLWTLTFGESYWSAPLSKQWRQRRTPAVREKAPCGRATEASEAPEDMPCQDSRAARRKPEILPTS